MWDLDARSLWLDEAVEYWSANVQLTAVPQAVLTSYQPPLYTYLLHMWLEFGMQATWLRLLSVGLSMLAVVGIVSWGSRSLGVRGGLIVGAIMALMPSEVRYAQEVGEYALMGCALTWTLNLLDKAVRKPSWRSWSLWGFVSVVSVYSHYGTSIVIASLAVVSFLENLGRNRRLAVLQQILVAAICLALSLPLLLYFSPRQFQQSSLDTHIRVPAFTVPEVAKLASSTGDTFLFQLSLWPYSSFLPKWIGEVLIACTFALSLLILTNSSATVQKRALWWLLAAYLTYFMAVRSTAYAYGNFGFRYALVLAPLFTFTVGTVTEQLIRWEKLPIALVLLSITAGLAVCSLPNRTLLQLTGNEQNQLDVQEDMREVARYWMNNRSGHEATYVYYGAAPAFRYYLRLHGLDTGALPVTWWTACWKLEPEGVCSRSNIFYGEGFRFRSPEEKLLSIRQALGGSPQHLWLIFSHIYSGEDNAILQGLLEHYDVVLHYQRGGASAYLLERH